MSDDLAILNSFTAACSLVAAFATLLVAIFKIKTDERFFAEATVWQR